MPSDRQYISDFPQDYLHATCQHDPEPSCTYSPKDDRCNPTQSCAEGDTIWTSINQSIGLAHDYPGINNRLLNWKTNLKTEEEKGDGYYVPKEFRCTSADGGYGEWKLTTAEDKGLWVLHEWTCSPPPLPPCAGVPYDYYMTEKTLPNSCRIMRGPCSDPSVAAFMGGSDAIAKALQRTPYRYNLIVSSEGRDKPDSVAATDVGHWTDAAATGKYALCYMENHSS